MKCGVWALGPFVLFMAACSVQKSAEVATENRVSPTYQGPPEATYCSTSSTFSDPVTITASAQYVKRQAWRSGGTGGLGSYKTAGVSHPAINKAIRWAEVRALDPAGNVVQCGVTDNSGNIVATDGVSAFTLPRGSVTYTLAVSSRAANDYLQASVLNKPEQNVFYSLTTTVVPTGAVNAGTLTASATGDLLGGAFNILDQLLTANEYLRAQVSSCSASFTGCRNVALSSSGRLPKVSAYWSAGFNPNSYFGSSSGLSFYLPGYSRLFILGGVNGVTDTVDTDHYDDSVIIHEYGHFLEDTIGNSDSPGGSHNGNKVIDPRLAWSEGWGDFFQAAVRSDSHYIDTIGNDDGGSTSMAFYTDLETAVSGADYPAYAGEGNFREFSVTRLLWDAIDNTPAESQFATLDNITGKFPEIWAAFSSTNHGFNYSGYSFRSVGLLHLIQQYFAGSNWSQIRAMERHDGDESHYGQYVMTSGCTAGTNSVGGNNYYFKTTANAIGYASDGGSLSNSDQFRNNLFFRIKPASAGSHTITLRYQDADGVAAVADLDLYLLKDDYRFGNSSDWLGYSRNDPNTANLSTPQADESVTATLGAGGNYMINVNVYSPLGGGTQAYFNLYYDGSLLCPATIVPP